MTTTEQTLTGERADLLNMLRKHRFFLRNTARDLTDEQAATRSTVSELCVGGLIKHVAIVETSWLDFIEHGVPAEKQEPDYAAHALGFQMLDGETLEVLLARYDEVGRRTEELLATLPDLDMSRALPPAPWFQPGEAWSARRVFMHIIAETAQHAGHADIVREAIDGAKSMG
jgi:uncharacterized damage-inducible protein DinB